MTKTTKGRKIRKPRCGTVPGQCQSRSGRQLLMNGTVSCVENDPELRHDHQGNGNNDRGQPLPEELGARGEAEAAPLDHLDVVIGKPDRSEGKRGENGDPDERIGWVGPQHGRQQNGDDDEDAAHGGGPGFFLVRLRPILADILTDLEFAELLDDVRPDEECDEQRREEGKCRTKREIAEDAERAKERVQLLVKQPVKQVASGARLRRVSY